MPVAFGHREVLIKAYVHQVVICHGAEVIARHPHSYERDRMVFEPLPCLLTRAAADRAEGRQPGSGRAPGWVDAAR